MGPNLAHNPYRDKDVILRLAKAISEYPYGRGEISQESAITRLAFFDRLTKNISDFADQAQFSVLNSLLEMLQAENTLDDAGNEPAEEYLRGMKYARDLITGMIEAIEA